MGNLTENKKLDFDAPFLSIRRLSAGAAAADPASSLAPARAPPPTRRRFSLPFYKSEVKSGPVCNPGVVPFVWEQTPGRPKNNGSRPPPKPGIGICNQKASIAPSKEDVPKQAEAEEGADKRPQQQATPERDGRCDVDEDEDEDEGDIFTDAPDTLSRTGSFLMTCSVSGVGSFREAPGAEPQVQEYMIARFLPAAQALASGSPQYTFRKPSTPVRESPRAANDRILSENLRRSPLVIRQHKLNHIPHLAEVINAVEEDYEDGGRLPSRGCGLLPKFSLKGSLCLLNPFSRMKDRVRPPGSRRRKISSPEIKNTHHTFVDEHLCEAVYRHKQQQEQQFTHWADSVMADGGWPPYRRSNRGGVSPYRYEAPPSPFREGKGFLGVPISDDDNRNADEISRHKTTILLRCKNQLEAEEEEDTAETKKTHAKAGWDYYSSVKDGGISPLQSPMLTPKSPSESWLLHASAKSPRPQSSFLGLRFKPSSTPNAKPDRKPQRLRFAEVIGRQPVSAVLNLG